MKRKLDSLASAAARLLGQGSVKDLKERIEGRLRPWPRSAPEKSARSFRKPEDAFFHRLSAVTLEAFFGSGAEIAYPDVEAPRVTVILVLFNKAELTLGCLRSLQEHVALGIEVILVDNASSDATSRMLDRIKGARIIRNQENVGFLLACNQAVEFARGEALLFLNNDTVVLPGAIEAALETLRSAADIGAVGARIVNLDGKLQEAGSVIWSDGSCHGVGRGGDPEAGTYMFRRDVDYCSGAFLLTPRTLFEEMGLFDRAYAPAYYEEVDYCMRLKERGLRVVYEPRSVLLHVEFGSAGSKSQAVKLMEDHQRVFQKNHVESLKKQHPNRPLEILTARVAGPQKRLLWLEDRAPHPFLGAGFPRSHELLKAVLRAGYQVTLFPMLLRNEEWHSVYRDIPREVEVMSGYGAAGLGAFLKERRGHYPSIMVSRPHNMEVFQPVMKRHPDWFEGVRVIYDAEAVFTYRKQSEAEVAKKPLTDPEFRRMLAEEMALASGATGVFSVSTREKALFERFGLKDVKVLSHSMAIEATPKGFAERRDMLFLGAVHWHPSPNSDSLLWFAREVFPLIRREIGDVRFVVAGLNNSPEVAAIAGDGIQLLGKVDDPRPLFGDARIFVAPTRFAAGIPLKCLEAASYGVPMVGTTRLLDQLGWRDGEEILSAEHTDPALFARKCVELYSDASRWDRVRENALGRVRREYSAAAFDRAVRELLP